MFWLTIAALNRDTCCFAAPKISRGGIVTILVIACPHAFVVIGGPSRGDFHRAGRALGSSCVRCGSEEARNLNVVVFDKTGPTRGEFVLLDVEPAEGETVETLSGCCCNRERLRAPDHPRHPDARDECFLPKASRPIAGKGAVEHLRILASVRGASAAERALRCGVPLLSLPAVPLVIADVVRNESCHAEQRLQQGIEVATRTGDAKAVAQAVASELGINHAPFAEVLPTQAKKSKNYSARQKGCHGWRRCERCTSAGS